MSEARIRFEPISTGHYKYQTKSEYDNYIKNSGYFPELEIGRTEVVYSHLSNEGYDIGLTRLDAKFKVINYDKADLNEEIRYNIVNGKLNINDNGDFIESVEYQERYDKNVNSNITANGVLTFLSTLYGFVTDPVTEGILLILGGIANTIDGESSVENITNIYRGSKRLSNINPSQDIVKNFRLDKEVELNNLYNNQNYTFKNKNYEYVQYQIFMGSKVKLEEVPNKLNVDMNITICHRQYNGDEKNIAFTWNLSKVYNRGLTYLEEGDVHTDIINQGGAFFNYQFVPNESRTYRYEVISDEDINLYLNNENILNYANLNYAIYEKNGKKILVFDIRNEINSINNIKINFQNILAVGTFSISIRQREKNIEINNSYKGEFLYEKDCYYFEYSPEYNTTYFIEIISDIPINVYYYDEICLLSSLGLQENYDGKLYYYTTSFNSEVDMWFMLESRSLGQIGSFSFSLYNDIDLGKIKYVNIVDQETIQINTDNVQIYTFRPEVSKNYRIEISNTNVSLYINGNQINNFKIGNGIIYSEINFSCLLTYRIMIDCDNTCDFAINSGKKMIYSFDNFLNVKVYDLANMSLIDDVNMMVTFYASKVDIANRAVTFDRILVSYYVEEGDPYYGISDFPVGLVFGETYPEMSNSLFLFLFLQQIIDNRYSPDICTFEGFINIDPFNNKDITVTFNETEFRNNLIETYTYEF